MEDIFPSLETRPVEVESEVESFDIPGDRDLLFLHARAFRWRFPRGESAQMAFYAVLSAFIRFTVRELGRYPETGVQWSHSHTLREILALSQKFFGLRELQNDGETEGQEDSEIVAERDRRSAALRARSKHLSE